MAHVDLPSSKHYAHGYFHIFVMFKSHIRVRPYAHRRAQMFAKQVIASTTHDGRSGMSVVEFRTAPPIGGLSCFLLLDTFAHWPRKWGSDGPDLSSSTHYINC